MDEVLREALARGKRDKSLRDRVKAEAEARESRERREAELADVKAVRRWIEEKFPAVLQEMVASGQAKPMGHMTDVPWTEAIREKGQLWYFDMRSSPSAHDFPFRLASHVQKAIHSLEDFAANLTSANERDSDFGDYTIHVIRVAFVYKK